jgi:hypothetical protein
MSHTPTHPADAVLREAAQAMLDEYRTVIGSAYCQCDEAEDVTANLIAALAAPVAAIPPAGDALTNRANAGPSPGDMPIDRFLNALPLPQYPTAAIQSQPDASEIKAAWFKYLDGKESKLEDAFVFAAGFIAARAQPLPTKGASTEDPHYWQKHAIFPVNILGGPMRECVPGQWENAAWPSEAAPTTAAGSIGDDDRFHSLMDELCIGQLNRRTLIKWLDARNPTKVEGSIGDDVEFARLMSLHDRAEVGSGAQASWNMVIAYIMQWADTRNPASAKDAELLAPIEVEDGRTYIPLPGGWEVQTKGKGSTFRICHVKEKGDYERWMVLDEKLHKPLEALALVAHAATK